MKIGILTDIHNNAAALKVALDELESQGCERYICCGDIIGIGPYPEETVALIRTLPNLIVCVKGNHETYLTEGMPTVFPNESGMGEAEMRHHLWEHGLLSLESKAYLQNLPDSEMIVAEGKKIYVAHYAMEDTGGYQKYVPHPSEDELKILFGNLDADIILYGHDHAPHVIMGEKTYINAGSLGCPGGEKNIARAGVLAIGETTDYYPVRIEYDAEAVVRDIERFQYPDYENIMKYFYGV